MVNMMDQSKKPILLSTFRKLFWSLLFGGIALLIGDVIASRFVLIRTPGIKDWFFGIGFLLIMFAIGEIQGIIRRYNK